MFKRDVKNITDLLNQFLRTQGLETPLLQRRVIEAWDEVVGPTVARYTGDKFIKNQTLFVKIINPALRQDLSMMRARRRAYLLTRRPGWPGARLQHLVHGYVGRLGGHRRYFLKIKTHSYLIAVAQARQQSVVVALATS